MLEFLDSHEFPRTNPIHIAGFSSFWKQFLSIGLNYFLGFLHHVALDDGTDIAEVEVSKLVSRSVLSWHSDVLYRKCRRVN